MKNTISQLEYYTELLKLLSSHPQGQEVWDYITGIDTNEQFGIREKDVPDEILPILQMSRHEGISIGEDGKIVDQTQFGNYVWMGPKREWVNEDDLDDEG